MRENNNNANKKIVTERGRDQLDEPYNEWCHSSQIAWQILLVCLATCRDFHWLKAGQRVSPAEVPSSSFIIMSNMPAAVEKLRQASLCVCVPRRHTFRLQHLIRLSKNTHWGRNISPLWDYCDGTEWSLDLQYMFIPQDLLEDAFDWFHKSDLTSTPVGGPNELKQIAGVPLCYFKLEILDYLHYSCLKEKQKKT